MFFNLNSLFLKILLISILIIQSVSYSQNNNKREFRGVWVASVVNLDWPTSNNLSVEEQKESLRNLFDKIAATNINAVVFQIRSECDAMYASNIEPWSYWLTGKQGRAPEPFYDPLEFAVEEAHKRGLELHAWFNPYRAVRQVGSYIQAANHVSVLHPEWIIRKGDLKILNPGLPQVREYVTSVIMDVVRRYDIDGVHFDDYFYPYPPNEITNADDQATFNQYPRGFTNIEDWRRDNVNELIRMVQDSINSVKPHIKFGISPFGIWKSGVPQGISGLDAYSTIYADAVSWLNEQIIDYLAPQLYWPFGGGQDYGKLLPWWASQTNGRHLYSGQALYRASDWSPGEIPRQIRLNRSTGNCYGNILFRAQNLYANPNGVTDSLTDNYYRFKALPPVMNWKDVIAPNVVENFHFGNMKKVRGDGLVWDVPSIAGDGDSAFMYAIYHFNSPSVHEEDLNDAVNLLAVTSNNYYEITQNDLRLNKLYFVVTALDRNFNESAGSTVVYADLQSPEIPTPILPLAGAINQPDTIKFVWNNSAHSSYNILQISRDSMFATTDFEFDSISDTVLSLSGMEGQTKYFWRVAAGNITGTSGFSEVRSFTTGFPEKPEPLEPQNLTVDVTVTPTFVWSKPQSATSFRLQMSKGLTIVPSNIILDTLISDTTLTVDSLESKTIYSWQVGAINQYGFSGWSELFKFQTETVVGVKEEKLPNSIVLYQNYPNPFGRTGNLYQPVTTIRYTVPVTISQVKNKGLSPQSFEPQNNFVQLKIYDILGRELKVLVNGEQSPGEYTAKFDGSSFPSGIYIYVLNVNGKRISKKMLLVK